jgi:uncharacterized protein (DUF2141 family)
MPKVLMIILGFVFAISTSAHGQELFTVSGEISFQEEKGQLYVWLKTQEEFEKGIKPTLAARSLTIKPNAQQLTTKKVTFKFVDIPKGVYGIQCHHDLNMNGKQDFGTSAAASTPPLEPYAFSGPILFGFPWWEDIKFDVDKDIRGLELKF